MRSILPLVALACFGCATLPSPASRLVYIDTPELLESAGQDLRKSLIPSKPQAGERDVLVTVLNGEFMNPMFVTVRLSDGTGERTIWNEKSLPHGFATFETKPTLERQLEAGCMAWVRVSGTKVSISVTIKERALASHDFEVSKENGEVIGALLTYDEIRFMQNGKPCLRE